MKKICLIALSYLILSFATKDQDSPYAFIKYFNECVNIYQAPTGREVTGCIFQDSINETNYYEVRLLEKSSLRFKVWMQAYETVEPIVGWIDKECIAVHPDILDDNQGYYVVLYNSPDKFPRKVYLKDKFDEVLTVIDYDGQWLKVVFAVNTKLHEGWVKDFCPNIYNSCN